ncbi:monosaccharide-transporting ATPase [Clostridia bacterium]|nr:monosaccharide-transporting ATPase [Clostridia bacterium]
MADQETDKSQFMLDMRGVSKQFPGTLAVDKVDFQVKAGEVHALMGENGAGKSTLMKMLAGAFGDYTGDVYIAGEAIRLSTPNTAKQAGVAMIYQELTIAYNRSVQENIFAGNIPTKHRLVDKAALRRMTIDTLKLVKLDGKVDPATPMKNISQHESQLIEIAKALKDEPKVLVMDEPTSALTNDEVETMYSLIREVKAKGIAIVYISHHLQEVFEIADRVTVLRDGKRINTCNVKDVTKEQLVEMMVGEKLADFYKRTNKEIGDVILEVENLTHYGFVHGASFHLRKGEILGLTGLAGSGRTELGRVLGGIDPMNVGTYKLEGESIKPKDMNYMVRKGVAYLTENRKKEGLSLRLSAQDNVFSAIIPQLSRGGFTFPGRGTKTINDLYEALHVVPNDKKITVSNLSGGNQQKVLLAKWMATKPKVLILDEPTRGVDVGAKKLIHDVIESLAAEGVSVLLISSDLPELVQLSDRILVLQNGHLIGEMNKEDGFSDKKVLLAANGERSALSVEF